jgi:hypothetical protein
MKLKRLFQVLVVGGATLGATMGCGPGGSSNCQGNNSPGGDGGNPDGGSCGGGGGGGGPQFW